MKRLLPVLMGFALLLLSSTEGWSLPPCQGSPTTKYYVYKNWTNCEGTLTYNNGDKYVGVWKDAKYHGQGTFTYVDGSKYVGEYKDNKRQGQGTYTYDDGTPLEGIWQNNIFLYAKKPTPTVTAKKSPPTNSSSLPPCPGSPASSDSTTMSWTDCFGTHSKSGYWGFNYIGEWKYGKYNGQGTITYAWGGKYVGEFKDGKEDGQGTIIFSDGSKYVGEWKNGKQHGQGTYIWSDGNKYVGEWKNDTYHGQGTYTYADGRVEEGIFENNKFLYARKPSPTVTAKNALTKGGSLPPCPEQGVWNNCLGTYTDDDGTKYVGQFKDSKWQPQGTPTYVIRGRKYVGDFNNGLPNGQGTVTYTDGEKYVGQWKDGKYHGQGTYTTASGDKYVGEFQNGKKHGQGTFVFANGNKYVGEFKDGKWHGQGTETYTNGDRYVGEFEGNSRHGKGIMTYANGEKYVGQWRYYDRHGQGTYTYADGRVEEGIFENNKFLYAKKPSPIVIAKMAPTKGSSLPLCEGSPTSINRTTKYWTGCFGTYTSTSGYKYVGEWKDGKRNGQGTLTLADGTNYVGEFKDWEYHGQGTFTLADGRVKEGMFEKGKFLFAKKPSPIVTAKKTLTKRSSLPPCQGSWNTNTWTDCFGTRTHANGSKYVGEWKDDKWHGKGTHFYASGDKYVGEWRDNKKNGQGTATYASRDKYVGEHKDGKRNGQGTYTYADGRVNEGIFENNKFFIPSKPSPTVTAKKPSPTVTAKKPSPTVTAKKPSPTVTAKKTPEPSSDVQKKLEELQKKIARLEKENKRKPKPKIIAKKTPTPKLKPVQKVAKRPDDIAVIIANSNYKKLGKDIPDVTPAYNDAENIKKYFMESLGVREGNIIYLKDATGAQLTEVFGNEKNHKAQLFDWVRPNKSNVHIYYAGHGAPASKDGSAYLVPSDAKSQKIEFSGYLLTNLYRNLNKIRARSVTVILEACFSGFSQGGAVLPKSSGIMVVARQPTVPSNVRVISAGAADQMASWEEDGSQSLFTKYFLKGMSGEGDKKPYGNGDGKVEDTELKKYLDDTMTYYARRYYGRDQTAQIVVNGKELTPTN